MSPQVFYTVYMITAVWRWLLIYAVRRAGTDVYLRVNNKEHVTDTAQKSGMRHGVRLAVRSANT